MAPSNKQVVEAAVVIAFLLVIYEQQRLRRNKRRWWVKPWKSNQRREAQSLATNLVKELRLRELMS